MTYSILTTVSGHPEQFDLDSLPLLMTWTDPKDPQNTSKRSARELLQEGKIGVHDLYRLLATKSAFGYPRPLRSLWKNCLRGSFIAMPRELERFQSYPTAD